jgi:hypothetical protein
MTTEVDALILRYLQDLEGELHDLPANRRPGRPRPRGSRSSASCCW